MVYQPALVNQVNALQILNIALHCRAGYAAEFFGDGADGYDLGGHIAEIQENAFQLRRVPNIVERRQIPLQHPVCHILPHDLLRHNVVVRQHQFRETAHLQIAVEMVLYLGQLHHDLSPLLLGHTQHRCDFQLFRELGPVSSQYS